VNVSWQADLLQLATSPASPQPRTHRGEPANLRSATSHNSETTSRVEPALTDSEPAPPALRLIAAGKSNQRIAHELVVTLNTVKKHVSHVLGKLGATNRTEAVTRARDMGVIS